jgi:soluble P-type ATPase
MRARNSGAGLRPRLERGTTEKPVIAIDIPGFGRLELRHLVTDYNGTLALDGRLLPGVEERLRELATRVDIHVVTADTFGLAASELAGMPVSVTIIPLENQAQAKVEVVSRLGAAAVAAIGNGRNDRHMLHAAALGIALIQREGAAADSVTAADVVCLDAVDALDLLRRPARLVATLRS